MYKLRNYSCFDQPNFVVKSDGGNHANVMDALIRKTAKITESYASDILYDIRSLVDSIGRNESFERLLVFRESGVSSFLVSGDTVDYICQEGIQFWKLCYDPEKQECTFIRVSVTEE